MDSEWRFVKIIDTIHPDLELPEICYKIMDTPEFQRLRYIKQIGSCSRIFPTATHTRFEHSIGVSHLAGKYVKILQTKQPELGINNRDILSLYIAGLTHDLGHGPFSHAFQNFIQAKSDPNYSHDFMALKMLDHLLNENSLFPVLEEHGLSLPIDLIFIKELILGRPVQGEEFQGRGKEKWFLYQIITNKATKVDVDRFDYVLRDCKQLSLETGFDVELIMNNTRVRLIKKGNENDEGTSSCIAYTLEVIDTLKELFKSRAELQKSASQSRVSKVIERMIEDAFVAANLNFRVKGNKDEEEHSLVDCVNDPAAFAKLSDTILDLIYNWEKGGVVAKRIVSDLLNRRLYWTIGELNTQQNEDEVSKLLEKFPCLTIIKTKVEYTADSLNSAYFYGRHQHHEQEEVHFFKLTFPVLRDQINEYLILRPKYVVDSEYTDVNVVSHLQIGEIEREMSEMKEKVLAHIAQQKGFNQCSMLQSAK